MVLCRPTPDNLGGARPRPVHLGAAGPDYCTWGIQATIERGQDDGRAEPWKRGLPLLEEPPRAPTETLCTPSMEGAAVAVPGRSPGPSPPDNYPSMSSTLAFDQHLAASPKGLLLLAEMTGGLLVWVLIGGTEYSSVPALGWVMFVAILCWVLTIGLFIVFLSRAHVRATWVPWNKVSVCFNGSATVLYLVNAAVSTASVSRATRGRHNYNCWASSALFAFLTTLCYAGSSWLGYRVWRAGGEEQ
ncbi:CKLF-like MARVEL transmembrane domain-containing protein 8b [Gadus morhua]|nr:CKLF-like MARVEL transmembrane domain-containing protein 8 [Gadus morhua]